MTLDLLNHMAEAEFAVALGGIVEDSPWVARRAWRRRPFRDISALHAALVAEIEGATVDERLAVLRAHPDLGSRVRMTQTSTSEQAGAGLDRLTAAEFTTLHQLNKEYRDRFEFPFLYAVRGSSKHEVIAALERRRLAAADEELAEALRQVARIIRFRLDDLLGS